MGSLVESSATLLTRLGAPPGRGKPVQSAHVDYTLQSGPGRLKELLPEEAESLQKHPYAVIQVSL